MRSRDGDLIKEVRRWFEEAVSCEGEAYTVDDEQAKAIVCNRQNMIVVARAGSGKTRTIVAKVVYLIAKCGARPEEILVFVFNNNAAAEVNARLESIRVNGEPLLEKSEIASTFHAYARKIVYKVCGGGRRYGKILVQDRENFIRAIIAQNVPRDLIDDYLKIDNAGRMNGASGIFDNGSASMADRDNVGAGEVKISKTAEEIWRERERLVKNVGLFINRAQQMYFDDAKKLKSEIEHTEADAETRKFWQIGMICYERYHDYLAGRRSKADLTWRDGGGVDFGEYGIDFNLLMKCAAILIRQKNARVLQLISNKKYILVDEYQDFSKLFLNMIQAIRETCEEARLFVVGDDWQAINRFAGSEVEYFRDFEKYFPGDTARLEITTNYRCDKMIVQNARDFMKKAMREKSNFKAKSRRLGKVIAVNIKECELELNDELYKQNMVVRGVPPSDVAARYLKLATEIIRKNRKSERIMILHRNNEMTFRGMSLTEFGRRLKKTVTKLKILSAEEFDEKVTIMTIHKSKGLEADVVILLEIDVGVLPALHQGAQMFSVFRENECVGLEDQKRLFYVALTRAKRRLYIMHNKNEKGGFVGMLKKGNLDRWE